MTFNLLMARDKHIIKHAGIENKELYSTYTFALVSTEPGATSLKLWFFP